MTSSQTRDLQPLFDPRSIVVVGASNDRGKWGRWLSEGALRGADRRAVWFVNKRGEEILGHRSYRSASELPDSPELAVIAVPPSGFEQAIDEVLDAGAKALVAVSAGFAEVGGDGPERQRWLIERIRAAGAMLVGPNCLGIVDTTTQLEAAWLQLGAEGLLAGPVALISQSGTVALDVTMLARDAGIGISRFVSLGNQADVTLTELVRSCTAHEQTRAIALYCEDFRDGREFLRATHEAVQAGKPVVLLSAGWSEAASRAARSHTGALTTDARVVEAACRATGAIKVDTPAELVDVLQMAVRSPRPAGRRVAIVSDGGGHGVVATDAVNRLGLSSPEFSADLQARLRDVLDGTSGTGNPIDFAAAGGDPSALERVVEIVSATDEVDVVLMAGFFGGWDGYDNELCAREAEVGRGLAQRARTADRPIVIQTTLPRTVPALAARDAGVPVYRTPEAAVGALARVVAASETAPLGVPSLPGDAAAGGLGDGGYFAVRRLLLDAGVPFPDAREVTDPDGAAAAADAIGYPVAVKAVELLHKSDAGGVALKLADAATVRAAVADMQARLDCGRFSVEAMADTTDGFELVVGVQRDPRFGPVLAVGLGGTFTEIFDDVVVALAPTAAADVERMLRDLRGAALLKGARGRPPIDLAAAAAAAAALSRVAAEHPDVAEIEVNPLLVTPNGALALDARALPTTDERDPT